MLMTKKIFQSFKMNWIHFRALVLRYLKIIVSDKVSFISLLLQAPLMVLIICLTCQKEFNYYNFNYALFEISMIAIFMALLNGYREVTKERSILIREYTGGLDRVAYIMSKFFVQALIDLLQAIILLLGTIFYFEIDYHGHPIKVISLYFLILFLTFLASTSISILISCMLKNSDSAILPILFLIIAQIVLSGAIMTLPEKIEGFGNITILKWTLGALGHVFDMESLTIPGIINLSSVYESSFTMSLFMLILFIIIPLILSIILVKRIARPDK